MNKKEEIKTINSILELRKEMDKKSAEDHIKIPNEIIDNEDLNIYERAILMVTLRYSNFEYEFLEPYEFAVLLGIEENEFCKYFESLIDKLIDKKDIEGYGVILDALTSAIEVKRINDYIRKNY